MTAAGTLATNVAAMIAGDSDDPDDHQVRSYAQFDPQSFVYTEGSDEDAQIREKEKQRPSNEYRALKCYCNDESLCPADEQDNKFDYEFDNNFMLELNSEQRKYKSAPTRLINIEKLLNATQSHLRHCVTNTVCLTKRVLRGNGDYWYKYSCDQSAANSIRGQVIEYRDCKVNTPNAFDRAHVIDKSPEFCCNEREYCNLNLHPLVSVRDLDDLPSYPSGNSKPLVKKNHLYFRNLNPTKWVTLKSHLITMVCSPFIRGCLTDS